MPTLSIPAENETASFARFGWAIRLSPMLVAIILATLWLAGAPADVPDLRFAAPIVARPGTSIGLRAWHLDRDDEGYPVVRAPAVDVELRNRAGLTIGRATLSPSLVQGVEGRLEIPSDVDGELSLIAHAVIDRRALSAERVLHVRAGIDSRLPTGRSVNAFQTYELGPMIRVDSARAPQVLDPRIAEGVCAPDLRCTLIVWVGDWSGRVRARSRAGVQPDAGSVPASRGFARLPLVVRGQEGRLLIEALSDDGVAVARRELRLPVLPGGLVARAEAEEESWRLEWEALSGPRSVLVDLFQEHRWVDARSLAPGDGGLGALPPGVWRLQVRADLFSDNTAAVAFAVVPDPRGADRLHLAADAVLAEAEREGLDPLAMAILDGGFGGEPEGALEALFAVPRFDVVAMGAGVSTTIGANDEESARAQERRRWWAAGAILALGLLVSMLLLRVELVAQTEARRLLEALGDGAPPPRRSTFGRGLWAFVLFVFVLMAVLALSKRWF
jgi:hypothetical protein